MLESMLRRQSRKVIGTPPSPRMWTANATDGRYLYLAGGYTKELVLNKELFIYDCVTNTWTQEADMPEAMCRAGGAIANNTLITVGGAVSAGATAHNRCYGFDLSTRLWSTKAVAPVSLFDIGVATSSSGLVFALGGHNGTGASAQYSRYDATANTWTSLANASFNIHGHQLLANTNNTIFVQQGRISSVVSRAGYSSSASAAWVANAFVNSPATARFGYCVANDHANMGYLFGGTTNTGYGTALDDFYQVNMNTGRFEVITPVGLKPPARHSAAMFYAEGFVYLFGGHAAGAAADTNGYLGDFWRYSPSANVWSQLS